MPSNHVIEQVNIKFSEIASTHTYWDIEKTDTQISFLSKAVFISERFINTFKFQYELDSAFYVTPKTLAEKIKDVVVEFANWPEWKEKLKIEEDLKALSWIDKTVPVSILINEMFWARYCVSNDKAEKKRILFIVSLCILHELGHSSIQWSTK